MPRPNNDAALPRNTNYGRRGNENIVSYHHPVLDETIRIFSPEYIRGVSWSLGTNKHPTQNYRYLALVTTDYFIGDIDTDEVLTYEWFAEKKKKFPENFNLRVYKTFKGYRFFITDATVYQLARSSRVESNQFIHKLFTEFECDPDYVDVYWYQRSFRARLAPKPISDNRDESDHITELLFSEQSLDDLNDFGLATMIFTHDAFCQGTNDWASYFLDKFIEPDEDPEGDVIF